MQATLTTVDPNEDGEGEPLVVNAPGFSGTISSYGVPQTLSFTAAQTSETISGYIAGYDADEAGTLVITVNPHQRFTQAQKEHFSKLASDWGYAASGAGAATGLCVKAPVPYAVPCGIIGAIAAAAAGAASIRYNDLAQDPPDPNYTTIVEPQVATLTPLAPAASVPPALATRFDALESNMAHQVAYTAAASTSINRANTAADAGDAQDEQLQLQAAGEYALGAAIYLAPHAALANQAVSDLRAAQFPDLTVTPNQVYSFEAGVMQYGIPDPILDALRPFDLSSADLNELRQLLGVQDVYAAAGDLDSFIENPQSASDEQSVVTALMEFATAYGTTAAPGQTFLAHGSLDSPAGERVDYSFTTDASGTGTFTMQDTGTGFAIQNAGITHIQPVRHGALLSGSYTAQDGSQGTFTVLSAEHVGAAQQNLAAILLSNGYAAGGQAQGVLQVTSETGN